VNWIHASRGRIEDTSDVAPAAGIKNIEVDGGRIVHDIGVMLAGKEIARAPHIGCQLIDFVKPAINHLAA
jgi:hypothetical protein